MSFWVSYAPPLLWQEISSTKVNRAFGPAMSSSIVSGPRLDSKALCRQLRVVLGWWLFGDSLRKSPLLDCVGMLLCWNGVVLEWRCFQMFLCLNGVMLGYILSGYVFKVTNRLTIPPRWCEFKIPSLPVPLCISALWNCIFLKVS